MNGSASNGINPLKSILKETLLRRFQWYNAVQPKQFQNLKISWAETDLSTKWNSYERSCCSESNGLSSTKRFIAAQENETLVCNCSFSFSWRLSSGIQALESWFSMAWRPYELIRISLRNLKSSISIRRLAIIQNSAAWILCFAVLQAAVTARPKSNSWVSVVLRSIEEIFNNGISSCDPVQSWISNSSSWI